MTFSRFDDLPCPVADGVFVANGLHLKEYTNSELSRLFLATGFRRARHFFGARGVYVEVPSGMMFLGGRWVRHIPLRAEEAIQDFACDGRCACGGQQMVFAVSQAVGV